MYSEIQCHCRNYRRTLKHVVADVDLVSQNMRRAYSNRMSQFEPFLSLNCIDANARLFLAHVDFETRSVLTGTLCNQILNKKKFIEILTYLSMAYDKIGPQNSKNLKKRSRETSGHKFVIKIVRDDCK